MARRLSFGTPGRSAHYLMPRRAHRFLVPSLLLGLAAAAVLGALHAAGTRTPLAPGDLISGHALLEARCEECHARHQGASNLRCQRCHDPSGGGRLTSASHALFGSGNPKRAAATPLLRCADCHVEHHGRAARLTAVDETTCRQCHFASLAGHPEFAVLRSPSREVPGIKFGHERHVQEAVKRSGLPPGSTCGQCHEPSPQLRDFEPLSFERHCASCHLKDGSLGTVDPIPAGDVASRESVLAAHAPDASMPSSEDFDQSRGRISRTAVRHKDAWILASLASLRRELDPEGYAAERGAQLARLSQLQRRLALAAPLAGMDAAALAVRESALDAELKGLEGRIQASRSAAFDRTAGLARLDELVAAATAAGDPGQAAEARRLHARAEPLRRDGVTPAPLPIADFEARRRELLALLDAVQATDPALGGRAEDLRRRLLALVPGEAGLDVLARVRDQRSVDRDRVRDEISLRGAGASAPVAALLVARQRTLQRGMLEAHSELDRLWQVSAPKGGLSDDARERKTAAVDALTTPCAKCHVIASGRIGRVWAARSVLTHASFVHRPHLLQIGCARCHGSAEKSKLSSDLNLPGIASCRECHRARVARSDCATCHSYHPPELP